MTANDIRQHPLYLQACAELFPDRHFSARRPLRRGDWDRVREAVKRLEGGQSE